MKFSGIVDRDAIEAESAWEDRDVHKTLYSLLADTTKKFPDRNALSFQLLSGPKDPSETLSWSELHDKTVQAANLFRSLGVGPKDVVAYILPNANETVFTLYGGAIAGIVAPINPLLEAEQIGSILRETNATVVVTLRPFPKTDVADKAAEAVALAPNVKTVLEVDLHRYLTGLKKVIVPLIRPKRTVQNQATYKNFTDELAKQPKTLQFEDPQEDRVACYFHTGGTTGMPKVAQHKYSGIIYNGWLGNRILLEETDNILCPLPLFHVFACHVILMGALTAGAHTVFPTPQGYRGDGVFDNIWKLVERWKVSFIIGVPTAISAMMQRPVDADISTVKSTFSGSAPLPMELYRRFEKATGVEILEGYGLTEATVMVSGNPTDGLKKVGSIGIEFPYTRVRIIKGTPDGHVDAGVDEVGEICVSNPGVFPGNTYTEADKNKDLYYDDVYLRTGDLGRKDEDGYIWITGRAKDLIIRGGHNIDPAEIEEALLGHEAVAFSGAIGQPDAHAGEIPCAYVELVEGASVTSEELIAFCKEHVHERAAQPKYIEIMDELPKTGVGKIFKPDLRRSAITRVFDQALSAAGVDARVDHVVDDKKRGLVAKISMNGAGPDAVGSVLGNFVTQWDAA
ncbi:acyl-CoA synthetase [Sulfitobacter donghicola]|uniref:AMP-binding protein n=1 Tax=Sulfitobacter donghicola DSW-25 = KCTC 12864 = JCM 14565 TaxID=1300350 RepID=A0A073IJA9_9RHOB|nr:acyl-CoA synthetase [Sulfitobacter donghicola]KEJ89859.1 AMP-binding protein [Sulfitobacter donghicola DSW-25 = KCTC 12864 = JCM 14565]KIN67020.1 Acyl-CoA synthase [Sulfitobacter donghicola DSW-25 = KCTC 12864 = JCM 14565]